MSASVLLSVPWQRRRRRKRHVKKTIQPMGSGFPHGPCSKGRTASGHGRTDPVESLILHGSWSWRIWPWALRSRSRARKELSPALISAPKLIHIPSNVEPKRYHPRASGPAGVSPKSAVTRLSICAYRKAASKKAQTPSSKFTRIPFSI
jgi:hypothetical protein